MSGSDLIYNDGDVSLNGYLAYDSEITGKRPGILVVHEAFGLTDHAMKRADRLASLGYVALAVDMFGDRKTARDLPSAMALMGEFNDGEKLRARIMAGLKALKSQPHVDVSKIAAIGFCFGGTTVLELARSGADVLGVVSFHGMLASRGEIASPMSTKVLVCHGGDDPLVPAEQVTAFQDEMRHAKADWQLNIYGGAEHSFTNEDAANAGMPGIKYQKSADERSWAAMRDLLDEIFSA